MMHIRSFIDILGGVTLAAAPWWPVELTQGLEGLAMLGGVVLVGLRIYLTVREIKGKK